MSDNKKRLSQKGSFFAFTPYQNDKRGIFINKQKKSVFLFAANAPDRSQAQQYLHQVVEKYAHIASDLAEWMGVFLPEGLTAFDFPEPHRRRIRTSNLLERPGQEVERRTRVMRIFPDQASCLRLVSAILMEMSEEWETGRLYLSFYSC